MPTANRAITFLEPHKMALQEQDYPKLQENRSQAGDKKAEMTTL